MVSREAWRCYRETESDEVGEDLWILSGLIENGECWEESFYSTLSTVSSTFDVYFGTS